MMAFLCNAASPLDDAWYTTLFARGAAKKNTVKGDIAPGRGPYPTDVAADKKSGTARGKQDLSEPL